MTRDPFHSGDDLADERIMRSRTRRTGQAVTHLCSSWIHAYADLFVGSFRVAGDVAEGLTDSYCDGERRRSRQR